MHKRHLGSSYKDKKNRYKQKSKKNSTNHTGHLGYHQDDLFSYYIESVTKKDVHAVATQVFGKSYYISTDEL